MDNNLYEEGSVKAAEYMRLALSFMGQHTIPVSPFHYRLSYDYVSGKDTQLVNTFDEILQKNTSPSLEELYKLYCNTYFHDYEVLEGMREELTSIITKVHGEFSRSGESLGDYAEKLTKFNETLNINNNQNKLNAEVQCVISATHDTEKSQRNIQSQLNNLSEEMAVLKNELNKAKEEALTDGLTGLSNRKAFDLAMDSAIARATSENSCFSLLLLDIDHFKNVNDTHGHLVGDKVLRYVGTTIKKCVKGDDIVARYGGEEFAVILHGSSIDGGVIVAEKIRKAVAAGILRDKNSQKNYGQVTISIGVSEFKGNSDSSEIITLTDQALYRAKDNGRNRVELAA